MSTTMFPIKDVTPLDLAFGGDMAQLMPKYDDIPKQFKHGNTWANKLVTDWFFFGVKGLDLKPREGVDTAKALRHIRAIITSFEPKHEHKEAGAAYLLDQWFVSGDWKRGK